MVTFDRRYRSDRKGYWRESVKRDTEAELTRELDALGERGVTDRLQAPAPEDRGISEFEFGPRATNGVRLPLDAIEPPPAVDRGAAPPLEIEVAAPAANPEQDGAAAEPETAPTFGQRVLTLLKRIFGPNY